jgi:hypothetical protein
MTIAQLLAQRDAAALRGDGGMVREITAYLARLGWEAEPTVATMERAVPKRQRRKTT